MRPVPNLTLRREDGRVVAESVTVADSTMRRLRGLLGKRDLPSGYGVLLRPAWSIHTAFMRFPIDVVFLDPDQVVIKIVPNLTPFKTASCRGAREIVEQEADELEVALVAAREHDRAAPLRLDVGGPDGPLELLVGRARRPGDAVAEREATPLALAGA